MYRCTTRLFLRHNSSLAAASVEGDAAVSAKLAEIVRMKEARREARLTRQAMAFSPPTPDMEQTIPQPPQLDFALAPAPMKPSEPAAPANLAPSSSVEARREALLARRAERLARDANKPPGQRQPQFNQQRPRLSTPPKPYYAKPILSAFCGQFSCNCNDTEENSGQKT
ncbi:hypothetical protein MIND_00508800 [Mycena indigotica]|uniref:Uncharacterized protein n=1 Tax=Mycena indigotica TaxID=2126181 RepID=A0A8H6W626_9AGAR|nr:uncharacterized protein MIND_00508800 [Mycena indigotica]KAF7307154.1 hypothetical protein MIND_00508800 [Mycena indigotica]